MMEKFLFKNENQKNNHNELFNSPKRQSSFKNIILTSCKKNTSFYKYLLYKKERENNKRKANSKEQNSDSVSSYVKAKISLQLI